MFPTIRSLDQLVNDSLIDDKRFEGKSKGAATIPLRVRCTAETRRASATEYIVKPEKFKEGRCGTRKARLLQSCMAPSTMRAPPAPARSLPMQAALPLAMATSLRRVLATFGCGDCGRLGLGPDALMSQQVPHVVRALLDTQLAAVACGGAHTAAVTDDGSLYTFGLNDRSQLGHSPGEREVPVPQEVAMPEAATAVAVRGRAARRWLPAAIATAAACLPQLHGAANYVASTPLPRTLQAGHYHTLALSDTGRVWAFGSNATGQLGLGGEAAAEPEPRLVKGLEQVVAIAAGAEHSLALTAGGEVYSWGCATDGRLGHGKPASMRLWGARHEPRPRLVRALEGQRVVAVAAGQMHSAALTSDGRLLVWGSGRFNQLGQGEDREHASPVEVPGLHAIAAVACGGLHTLAVQQGGTLLSWGANQNGCLGLGSAENQQPRRPSHVDAPQGLAAAIVAAGWKHSAAVGDGGSLYTWGWGGSQGERLCRQAHQIRPARRRSAGACPPCLILHAHPNYLFFLLCWIRAQAPHMQWRKAAARAASLAWATRTTAGAPRASTGWLRPGIGWPTTMTKACRRGAFCRRHAASTTARPLLSCSQRLRRCSERESHRPCAAAICPASPLLQTTVAI